MHATLNEMLLEVEQTANFDASSNLALKKILANIKMLCLIELPHKKSLNYLVNGYCIEMLSEWDVLSTDEQVTLAIMHHFLWYPLDWQHGRSCSRVT